MHCPMSSSTMKTDSFNARERWSFTVSVNNLQCVESDRQGLDATEGLLRLIDASDESTSSIE